MLTSGKALESRTAKHRLYRLWERVCYSGVEPTQNHGERRFLKEEAHLSRARHLILVGDGADWVEALVDLNRWRATYQVDGGHLTHTFHRTFPDQPKLVHKLKQALYKGQGQKILPILRMAQLNAI